MTLYDNIWSQLNKAHFEQQAEILRKKILITPVKWHVWVNACMEPNIYLLYDSNQTLMHSHLLSDKLCLMSHFPCIHEIQVDFK
jgi:hypothetical protein